MGGNLLLAQNCPSIEFNYDATGNRIQRHQIQIFCVSSGNNTSRFSDNDKNNVVKDTLNTVAYPNPTSDKVLVNIIDDKNDNHWNEIYLIDVNGRVLYYSKTKEKMMEISMYSYKSGIYFLRVLSDKKQKIFQIIKTD
ncbi:MAG: hypothetical protein OHK0036_09330 [Bacteroidia bacterium]